MSRRQHVSFFLSVALFLLTLAGQGIAETINDLQIRVPYDNADQLRQLYNMGLDVVFRGEGEVDIITNPDERQGLEKAGFATEIIHESVSAFYRSRLPQKDMGGYMTLSEVEAAVDQIIADHPSIVTTRQVYGSTLEGRDWYAIKISDNPYVDEEEPEVLFTGAIHAREVITPLIMLAFMDRLTDNYGTDPVITELVDEREVWFVPIVNPDGYYHNEVIAPGGGGMWRKNRRANTDGSVGVDLNRNFDHMWGVGGIPEGSSEVFPGAGPFSEPAAQAYRDLVEAREFIVSMDFHAYSNALLWPWGYSAEDTEDSDLFYQLAGGATSFNGYALWPPYITGAAGMTVDWLYGEQTTKKRVLALLMEVGTQFDGFWPLVERIPPLVSENMMPMQYVLDQAEGLSYVWRPDPPELVVPAEAPGGDYTVSWTSTDAFNPAVDYELTELTDPYVVPDRCDDFQDWQVDGFATSSARVQSGPLSFYSGPGPQTRVTLTTTYPLEITDGDILSFKLWYELGLFTQFFYVEVSTDGINFATVPGNLTSDFNPYGGSEGNAITGMSLEWVDAEYDLSAYAGESVFFRLRCDMSNVGESVEGVYIDDCSHHLRYDQVNTIVLNAATTEYNRVDQPLGEYFYCLRARDAESQWSFSTPYMSTRVLNDGVGDIDLDGVTGSIADLTQFNLYFQYGLSAFDLYPDLQINQSDVDCDGMTGTGNDLTTLGRIVIGELAPCYDSGPSPSVATDRLDRVPTSAGTASAASSVMELQATSFEHTDSVWIDIVLVDGNADMVGYQFHLELDTAGVAGIIPRLGDELAEWDYFDAYQETENGMIELTLAAVAWTGQEAIDPSRFELTTLPRVLARLKLELASDTSFTRSVDFVWDGCGDNGLVTGAYDGMTLEVTGMSLSHAVFDSESVDITDQVARYGGAEYDCFFGLFGALPTRSVDYTSGAFGFDAGCCIAQVGDANGSGDNEPTIGDVSVMIDALFIGNNWDVMPCLAEADLNQSGGAHPSASDITIGDVSYLIDYLFITGTSLGLTDCL